LPERYLGEPCPGDEYYRVLRGARVALGINRVPSLLASDRRPLTYSRLRDIEAPMLGACYLTEWTAGLERLYDLGEEIEVYRTAEELAAKLNELCADPKRRMSMRARAQRRALGEHSVARSIERIAERLGMKSAA
jgi:spore maturation protein CgeB